MDRPTPPLFRAAVPQVARTSMGVHKMDLSFLSNSAPAPYTLHDTPEIPASSPRCWVLPALLWVWGPSCTDRQISSWGPSSSEVLTFWSAPGSISSQGSSFLVPPGSGAWMNTPWSAWKHGWNPSDLLLSPCPDVSSPCCFLLPVWAITTGTSKPPDRLWLLRESSPPHPHP